MKKRLISLVAAAALVGGVAVIGAPQVAKAGTVTVKGDTQATLYGFVWAEYGWTNKIAPGAFGKKGADYSNMPMPSDYPDYNYAKKTATNADAWVSRIGFAFKNEDANLTGRIEGGFFHGTNFRLRRAYVEHHFNNFDVLIGQEWILEENFASISAAFTPPAGWDEGILRVPQIRVSTKLDLGSATLDLALALEWGNKDAVTSSDQKNLNGYASMTVNRVTFPTTALRGVLHFDTGFGAPAKIYGWGAIIPVKLTSDNLTASNEQDKSKTAYALGGGVSVPVSMVIVGANVQYSKGATNYAGLTFAQPASYYTKNGDTKATKMLAWNINAVISPMPNVSFGGEYDYVQFKNDDAFASSTKPKVETVVGQVRFKPTKYTSLTLEWRHIKAKNFDVTGLTTDDNFKGNQVFALCMYKF